MPKLICAGRQPKNLRRLFKIFDSSNDNPPPPYSTGHSGVHQPFDTIASNHTLESLEGNSILEEAHTCSLTGIGVLMDCGQLSSIHASTSFVKLINFSSIVLYLEQECNWTLIN